MSNRSLVLRIYFTLGDRLIGRNEKKDRVRTGKQKRQTVMRPILTAVRLAREDAGKRQEAKKRKIITGAKRWEMYVLKIRKKNTANRLHGRRSRFSMAAANGKFITNITEVISDNIKE